MNDVPPSNDDPADLDEQYRRAAQLDRSRPSDAVRRAILEHATQRAAQHAAARGGPAAAKEPIPFRQRSARYRPRWPLAVVGTLAAAGIAGLLVAPQLPWRLVAPGAGRTPAMTAAAPQSSASPRSAARQATVPQSTATQPTAPQPTAPQPDARQSAAAAPPRVEPFASALRAQAPAPQSEALAARTERQASGSAPAADEAGARSAGATAKLSADFAPRAAAAPPADNSALRQAAANGDLQTLRSMLGQPRDIDAVDAFGRTALMLATLNAKQSAVEVLLSYGANPNIADAQGRTPLAVARELRQPEIAAALQRAGAR
jgi:Ankyrin repeats (3 copies)